MQTETGEINTGGIPKGNQNHWLELTDEQAKRLKALEPKERLKHIPEIKYELICKLAERAQSKKMSKSQLLNKLFGIIHA